MKYYDAGGRHLHYCFIDQCCKPPLLFQVNITVQF